LKRIKGRSETVYEVVLADGLTVLYQIEVVNTHLPQPLPLIEALFSSGIDVFVRSIRRSRHSFAGRKPHTCDESIS